MAAKSKSYGERVTALTPRGTFSFPHVFKSTTAKNDKGEAIYEIQLLIPKSDRKGVRALLEAIEECGRSHWKDNWVNVRNPLRDGDKEKNDMTDDGQTKGEKYPERLGHYILTGRSKRPVAVVDRDGQIIDDEDEIYPGAVGRLNVNFFNYSNSGNHGIGVGLNGVQKIKDGERIGGTGSGPSVESMFDTVDDEDDDITEVKKSKKSKDEPESKKSKDEPEAKKGKKGKKSKG